MTDRPIRVQLSRKKGWKMPPNTVKVSRPSKWGNAAKIGDDISYYSVGVTCATAADVVALFRRFMEAHRAANPVAFAAFIAPLRGKNLACWCAPDAPCHADVLLKLANEAPAMTDRPIRIIKLCRKCGGSGNKLAGVKPIRFKPCNKCCGRGGRTEARHD